MSTVDVGDTATAPLVDELHLAATTLGGDRSEREPLLRDLVVARLPLLPDDRVERLVTALEHRLDGLGPIEHLLHQPGVTDILINGPGPVWVERHGVLQATGVDVDAGMIRHLIQRIVGPQGLRADRSQPTVDARLPSGGRLHAVLPPIAVDGPYVSIRRPSSVVIGIDDLAPPDTVALLRELVVDRRCNILVCGSTGAGKTTLVDALGSMVDPTERLIVLEESCELRLIGRHVVRLVTRRAGAEGGGATDLSALVAESLRMRPDRLLLGEVRGPEALDLVHALSTGHSGCLATIHAAAPAEALRRLETLALSADVDVPHASLRRHVGAAIDIVVLVARSGGRRSIESIDEVDPTGDPDLVRRLADGRGPVELPRRSRGVR